MKKIYLTVSFALLCFITAFSQELILGEKISGTAKAPKADEYVFGYCLEDTYSDLFVTSATSGLDVAFAICIPESIAQQLQGNVINAVRIAFNNSYKRDICIFITEDLDGDDEYALENQRLSTVGWNEVSTENAYEINGNTFYVGFRYTYYYSTQVSAAMFDGSSFNENACWSNIGNAGWNNTDCYDFGALSLQIVMSGDATLGTEANLMDIIMPTSAMSNAQFTMRPIVRNTGGTEINEYNIYYSVDGGDETKVSVTGRSVEPNASDTTSILLAIAEDDIAEHTVYARLEVEGDTDDTNNEVTKTIIIYTMPVSKKVLLEDYTGMECSYCAEVNDHLDTYLNQWNVADKAVIVAHHVYKGNYYDYYALQTSIEYASFFGMTGAPQMMIDRDTFGGSSVMFNVLSYDPGSMVYSRLQNDCFTSIGIDTEYDSATRELKITVSGTKYLPLTGYPTLHVWLTEDGLINWQNSSSGLIYNYEHNHVMRVFVTGPTGDELDTEAGYFEKTYTVTIPESIQGYGGDSALPGGPIAVNDENINVVAFVANFNTSNYLDCEVINVNTCEIGGYVSGVEKQATEDCKVYSYGGNIYIEGTNIGAEVYSLSGMQVKNIPVTVNVIDASSLPKGMYIVKVKTSTNGNKIVKKVLVK